MVKYTYKNNLGQDVITDIMPEIEEYKVGSLYMLIDGYTAMIIG